MSSTASIGASQLDRKHVSGLCLDAALEIGRLRRRIEGLEARLDRLRHRERC
jgi:hypothetical protein